MPCGVCDESVEDLSQHLSKWGSNIFLCMECLIQDFRNRYADSHLKNRFKFSYSHGTRGVFYYVNNIFYLILILYVVIILSVLNHISVRPDEVKRKTSQINALKSSVFLIFLGGSPIWR